MKHADSTHDNGIREALEQIGAGTRRLIEETVKNAGQFGKQSFDYYSEDFASKWLQALPREPLVVIAGSFAAGLLAAKLMKGLQSNDHECD